MARTSTAKPTKTKKEKEPKKAAYEFDYGTLLDKVERSFKLTANMTDRFKYAISSGLLVQDLVLGGGLVAGGMYTVAGMEQTAKSTNVMNFLAKILRLVKSAPKILAYFDAEGSMDPDYFGKMLAKATRTSEIFGVKDAEGKYVVKPRIRYYPENRGEVVLDSMHAILKRLPDKELIKDTWYYVFENTKENQKNLSGEYDVKLFSKFNKFYVPTEETGPQAIFVVDSWPALVTERQDDDEAESGGGLGQQARMFAENLPRIKGKLRRKAVILLGINQLREKPMARGDPRYEPGGNALKFNSDVRMWQSARAVPHASGAFEEEKSVFGEGTDTYRYIHSKAIKNKLSTPYLEGWYRLWVSDIDGQGHGYCPVWDTFCYLKMTGQVEGTMKKIRIPSMFPKKVFTWLEFKALILHTGVDLKKTLKKLGLKTDPKIRQTCFAQLRKGEGARLMFKKAASKSSGGDEE